ncbi:hypothetical protein [Kribbella shirazensis]|uniref:Uncharacterized protein n=1 Tax=Kribbella shirazensis TaxID=1105143 RepID=A0A7X6A0T9_9ACTN|nr:hypothetical protein [Kribbella shirazensis]NIK57557.1 hypothetical protein [Kribbella shirazensis]
MPEYQALANVVLTCLFLLPPIGLGMMLAGRSRGNRSVLEWARALAIVTIVLAVVYDVAGAVFLLLSEPRDGSWMTPPGAADDPYFYLPVGVGAFLAGLGILVGAVRARYRLG